MQNFNTDPTGIEQELFIYTYNDILSNAEAINVEVMMRMLKILWIRPKVGCAPPCPPPLVFLPYCEGGAKRYMPKYGNDKSIFGFQPQLDQVIFVAIFLSWE